jgi:hypothetical protein
LQQVFVNFTFSNFDQWRKQMQEQQCDDFFIPAFLLTQPPQPVTDRRDTQIEDFLKGIQGWTEYFWIDECVE